MNRFVQGILSLLFCLAPARGEDWPEFRGAKGDGVYNGKLPTEWGPDKNVAWKAAIPGQGWSSPILWKGKLYLTTGVKGKDDLHELRALCIDAASGKIDWDVKVFDEDPSLKKEVHKKNSPASPTPATDGERLYFHFGPWGTAALDFAGKTIWTRQDLKFKPQHGNGGSPIVHGGKLVFTCDGADQQYLMALDAKTGTDAWKTKREPGVSFGFSFTTPLVIAVDGKEQIVAPASGMAAGYDPADGKELWRVKYAGFSLIQRPVFAHGLVYLQTGYVRGTLLAVKPDGKGDVTASHVAWKATKGVPNTPSYQVAGDEIYMVSDGGVLTCMDAKTGKEHYTERLPGQFSASPLFSDGKIYLTTETGTGLIVKAGTTFEQLYKTEMGEKTFASFVPGDGAMYVRTETKLYKFK